MCLLALSAAPASAAAPANDNFADREALSGSLPIEVMRSNVEATKEAGENLGSFQAGHSIWFEWEAPSSDWFTIGACDENFRHVVGIFTGSAVGALTKVASGNRNEGPNCPFTEKQFSFKATAGIDYEIAIDGNPFFVPPSPPPPTEGSTTLRIEETPDPPNDDFAAATPISGSIEVEPGQPGFYFANVLGFNWTATKEAAEPDHAGDPGGASVWYSWTAPLSGTARIGVCCGFEALLAMYSGTAVGALTPVASTSGFAQLSAPVVAGTSYRLAVDGSRESASGQADRAGFQLQILMNVPPAPIPVQALSSSGGPPPADTVAPDTTIRKRTVRSKARTATVVFQANEPGSTFRCRLDDQKPTRCASPRALRGLAWGSHTFSVYAVDAAGNADPTPARTRFSIVRPRQKHG